MISFLKYLAEGGLTNQDKFISDLKEAKVTRNTGQKWSDFGGYVPEDIHSAMDQHTHHNTASGKKSGRLKSVEDDIKKHHGEEALKHIRNASSVYVKHGIGGQTHVDDPHNVEFGKHYESAVKASAEHRKLREVSSKK